MGVFVAIQVTLVGAGEGVCVGGVERVEVFKGVCWGLIGGRLPPRERMSVATMIYRKTSASLSNFFIL